MLAIPSHSLQPNITESVGNSIAASDVSPLLRILGSLPHEGASHLHNMSGSNPAMSSSGLSSKQINVQSELISGTNQCMLSQVGQMGSSNANVSDFTSLLPPFPGREYSTCQGAADPQSNHLFGINSDSSTQIFQHGISNPRNVGSQNDSMSMPFGASDYTSASGTDFPLNSEMTTSSCVDESGFLQSSEKVDQMNPPTRTFVKVRKLWAV